MPIPKLLARLTYKGELSEVHLFGPIHTADAAEAATVTELHVPIAPIREG